MPKKTKATLLFKQEDSRRQCKSTPRQLIYTTKIISSSGISVCPSTGVIYSNRAAAYLALKAYDDALVDACRCLEIDNTFAKAHFRKAAALKGLERYDEATSALEELKALAPKNLQVDVTIFIYFSMLTSSTNYQEFVKRKMRLHR